MRHRDNRLLILLVVGLLILAGCTGSAGPSSSAPETTVTDGSNGMSSGGSGTPDEGKEASPETAPEANVSGALEVHFINVGQGDSTLIVGPTDETILVDTGDFRDDGSYVIDYLESQGIDRIDVLVSTHADADHIGGNAAVIEHFETEGGGVGAVYDPGVASSTATYGRYLDAVEQYEVPLYQTLAGDHVPLDGARVTVLGPPQPYLADGERNENSIVLRVEFGQTSVLLTGDAGPDEEPYLVETHGQALDVTLLKAGHHGSSSSTSAALLNAATPKAAIISSDYDSRYGHPHEEVLGRLAARSVPTYWTGTHGTIVATSDGAVFEVATQADATTQPRDLRVDAPVSPDTQGPVVVRAAYRGEGTEEVTGSTDARLEISEIHADAAGDDTQNLADEYVVVTNRGSEAVDLSGWVLTDESGARYVFPEDTVLDAGESVTVRTGDGTDTATERYWGAGRPVWNNDGDTVTILRPDGRVVVEVSY